MKLIYFSIAFFVLLGAASFARGLEITEIRFYVSYDDAYVYRLENKERASWVFGLTNNSKINADVLPGSNISFTIRLANTLQGGHESELRDVFARVRIEEIDDGSDLEETSMNLDLDGGNDDLVDVNFNIPVDVKTGTYKVLMEAEADSRNHTPYRTEINLKLEIKKESHDIRITRYQLSPSTIDCSRKIKLIADIMNAGSNFEESTALEFKSDELRINSITRDIPLESSNDAIIDDRRYTKTLNADIPNSLRAGTYPILINLYWKNTILFDQKILTLSVRDCGSAPSKEKQNETGAENSESSQQPENGEGTSENIPPSNMAKFFPSPALLLMLLGGFVLLIIIIVLILYSGKKAA